MSDWQPIETAPKDGTMVLLCTPDWISMAWMLEREDGSRVWAIADSVDGEGVRHLVLLGGVATHWMALPSPPVPA